MFMKSFFAFDNCIPIHMKDGTENDPKFARKKIFMLSVKIHARHATWPHGGPSSACVVFANTRTSMTTRS